MKKRLIAAAALTCAGSANAALINQQIYLTATNFHADDTSNTTPAPYPTVSGTFSLTYDNAVSGQAQISASNFTLPITSLYSYYIAGDIPQLLIETVPPFPLSGMGFQFTIELDNPPYVTGVVSYSIDHVLYNNAILHDNDPSTSTIRIVTTPLAASVPEPASWAMLIGGLGAVGAFMRRRRVAIRFA